MNETTPSTIAQKSNLERKIIRRERLSLIAKNKTFLVGAAILSFWIILAIFGNFIAPRGASDQDFEFVSVSPQWKFWFGTDANGQDVLSRVILGTRLIVVMAFTATALGTVLGTALGLATGYFKGKFDMVVMRLVEAVSAIPVLIIALLAIAALEGRSPTLTVIVIGFVFTPNIGRTVRAAVLGESELEYVAAARLRTERTRHILFREILPNVLPLSLIHI
jgi:peptide/nickel transport system permease protein